MNFFKQQTEQIEKQLCVAEFNNFKSNPCFQRNNLYEVNLSTFRIQYIKITKVFNVLNVKKEAAFNSCKSNLCLRRNNF